MIEKSTIEPSKKDQRYWSHCFTHPEAETICDYFEGYFKRGGTILENKRYLDIFDVFFCKTIDDIKNAILTPAKYKALIGHDIHKLIAELDDDTFEKYLKIDRPYGDNFFICDTNYSDFYLPPDISNKIILEMMFRKVDLKWHKILPFKQLDKFARAVSFHVPFPHSCDHKKLAEKIVSNIFNDLSHHKIRAAFNNGADKEQFTSHDFQKIALYIIDGIEQRLPPASPKVTKMSWLER